MYWSRSFLGRAECLSEVRKFTVAVLGDRPGTDLVVLAASELAANAILHTASGEPGGQFVVHLATFADRCQIRVDDAGGPKVPRACSEERPDAEAGRGLALIDALSLKWGVLGDERSRAVWAEIPFPFGWPYADDFGSVDGCGGGTDGCGGGLVDGTGGVDHRNCEESGHAE
jgi:serine/threonine-protein kinase RsbW